MSLLVSTQAELLKTRRTASFWLSISGAAFIPLLLFIALLTGDDATNAAMAKDPWKRFFGMGWQILSVFLLPMYIILVSTLITQIEFKNNTWKQVFASPQSLATIYFSKFLTIQLMIIFCCGLFNVFMILSAFAGNLFKPGYGFSDKAIDWKMLLQLNFKTYVSILGISALQYWLSMRFKNFIVPLGLGLAMVIAGIIALNVQWTHLHKYPYAFPILTYDFLQKSDRPFLENHELNSIGYFLFFLLAGFVDLVNRKEKG